MLTVCCTCSVYTVLTEISGSIYHCSYTLVREPERSHTNVNISRYSCLWVKSRDGSSGTTTAAPGGAPASCIWTLHISRQAWLADGAAVSVAGEDELRASTPRHFRAAPEKIFRHIPPIQQPMQICPCSWAVGIFKNIWIQTTQDARNRTLAVHESLLFNIAR